MFHQEKKRGPKKKSPPPGHPAPRFGLGWGAKITKRILRTAKSETGDKGAD